MTGFDVEKARKLADYFLEYPDEQPDEARLAMMMRAACNEIDKLRKTVKALNTVGCGTMAAVGSQMEEIDRLTAANSALKADVASVERLADAHAAVLQDRDRLTARLAEVEKERDSLLETNPGWQKVAEITNNLPPWQAAYYKSEAKVARYREALEFYADGRNYAWTDVTTWADMSARARAALAGGGGEEK